MKNSKMRRRLKNIRQTPYLQCFVCKHIIKGYLAANGLVMNLHNADTGDIVTKENFACIGKEFPNLAVVQQIGIN